MTVAALIVAAGRSTRLGGVPKPYRELGGEAMLCRTLRPFLAHPVVTAVQTVIDPAHRAPYDAAMIGLDVPPPVAGGATRQASVLAGLEALAPLAPERVLIQDGARPFVTRALIDRVLAGLERSPGVLPALPVVDSLRQVDGAGRLAGEVAREGLVRAQTPQGFAYPAILDAHRRLQGGTFTDDAALARAAGMEVAVVMGEEENLKVTHPEDLVLAERQAAGRWRWRTGTGFDVHALTSGRPCILGGIAIPHERGLAGHSDADVALHALTDAILGTIGAGDIGLHFPPSDPTWQDADSSVFLREAMRLLREREGVLEHIDLTVICERPKIGPHREAMRARVAELAGLAVEDVSIKATTTERLGFAGRGEGIAVQAAATVRLPWRTT